MDSTKGIGLLFAGVLLTFALWQYRELRRRSLVLEAKKERMNGELFSFLAHQTVRRLNMSLVFGLAALAMLIGCFVPGKDYPRLFLGAWGGAICLILWGMLLTLFDYIAVRLHYSIEKHQNEAEKIGLEYALKKLREKEQQERGEEQAPPKEEERR